MTGLERGAPDRRRKRAVRIAWIAAGWIFFAVGVIGVVLPGLPTTGPMLLAIACFARGSERLHRWLLNHRLFGTPIRRWQRHRVIPIRAKVTAILMMAGSIAYLVWLSGLPTWIIIAFVGLVLVGVVVVLRIPHRITADKTDGRTRNGSSDGIA